MKIDITMPCTLRPEIIRQTLETFCKHLFTDRDRYRLIVNIDPIGEDCAQNDIMKICKGYFPNIIANKPDKPHFPTAFKWCWDQAESKYIFHMNEDWKILRKADIDKMIAILENNPQLATLRLSKHKLWHKMGSVKLFGDCIYRQKKGFLIATRRNDQFGTNPCLLNGNFVKQARKHLTIDANPEKQFRRSYIDLFEKVVMKWDYGLYGKPNDDRIIVDTGEKWKEEHGFQKKNGCGFTEWERVK